MSSRIFPQLAKLRRDLKEDEVLPQDEEGPLSAKQLRFIPPVTESMTVPKMYWHRAKVRPNSRVAQKRTEIGGWRDVSIEELLAEVEVLARGLIGLGLKPKQTVALLASNSYEWMLLDLAIMSAGGVTVPIYETDSAKQIAHILKDADIQMVFTDTTQQADLIRSVADDSLDRIYTLNRGARRTLEEHARYVAPIEVTERVEETNGADLATIIYTSGTTGVPKGVALTHRNFVGTTYAVQRDVYDIALSPATKILLFLPLAHVLARFVMHGLASGAGTVGFSPDTTNLVGDIASFKPTALLVVPRVLEKVYNSAQAKAGGGAKGTIFSWAAHQAREKTAVQQSGEGKRSVMKFALADALVLQKIKKVLGSHLKYVVSGGAPLATDLAEFYRGLGLTVMEGYGLSETTGPITVQRPNFTPAGTVGPAIWGNEVKVSEDDGEVLLKGISVFSGYHNLPEETAESFTPDGWFKTGDIGRLDEDGQLTITGRKKGIIVTAGGKNVSPEILEDRLVTHPLIGHVLVVGDQKPFVGAVITLDPEMLPVWLSSKNLPVVDPVQAAEMPEVKESLQKAIDKANSHVSRAESIRKFSILNTTFTIDNGYLTPSLKLRRNKVLEDYGDHVEELYEGVGEAR